MLEVAQRPIVFSEMQYVTFYNSRYTLPGMQFKAKWHYCLPPSVQNTQFPNIKQ